MKRIRISLTILILLTIFIPVNSLQEQTQNVVTPDFVILAELTLPAHCDPEILDSVKSEYRKTAKEFDSVVFTFFEESSSITQDEFERNPEQYDDALKKLSNYLLTSHVKLMERLSKTGSYLTNVCFEDIDSVYKLRPSSVTAYQQVAGGGPYLMSRDLDEVGGCLIATAAYGTELAPQVQQLRELRDNIVLQTKSGTSFLLGFNQIYYSFSPTIADLERESLIFREFVKFTITPLLTTLSILNYADIDSEEEMLWYGTGVILLNIGIYFGTPVFGIILLRRYSAC